MAMRLDNVELGPVRVIGRQTVPASTRRATDWNEVVKRAKSPPAVLARHRASRPRAAFDAGSISRVNTQWNVSTFNANREIRWGLVNLRARSRDLERNDPYVQKFLELVSTNVVGANGIGVQSRSGDVGKAPEYAFVQDALANRIIEKAWAEFSRAGEFDVTGKLSRSAFERLLIRTVARDGEALVKIVSEPESRCGVRFQLLEADWLDETMNEDRKDGSRVVMGVELSPAGRPVAYWLRTRHPGDTVGGTQGNARARYTAGQVRHYFIADRPEQVRGVPWAHAAMSRLYQLGEFDDAALLAARIGASKVGFYQSPDGEVEPLVDNEDPARPQQSIQAGEFATLPAGYSLSTWDPAYPSDAYGPFVLATLRGVASGLGVSYESLSGDREGVTWTSIRHAVLDEREQWKVLQDWFIESWSWDAYTAWLDAALLAPGRPLLFLPAAKRDKFLAPVFTGRRWDWVNPKDDIEAKEMALRLRLTSHRRVLAEQGMDLEELLAEIAADFAMAETYGIDLDAAATPGHTDAPHIVQQPDGEFATPPARNRRAPRNKKPQAGDRQ